MLSHSVILLIEQGKKAGSIARITNCQIETKSFWQRYTLLQVFDNPYHFFRPTYPDFLLTKVKLCLKLDIKNFFVKFKKLDL